MSLTKRKVNLSNSSSGKNFKAPLSIGGQAVIEGVMIKSDTHLAVAVRKPNKSIVVLNEKVNSLSSKYKFLKLPFLRGMLTLYEVLIIGIKSLNYSAIQAMNEKDEKENPKSKISTSQSNWEIFFTFFISLALALIIFKLLPLLLTYGLGKIFTFLSFGIAFNLLEGLIKITILVLYILLISQLKDVKTIFKYHGAEHKAIACYEAGYKLNVKNARKFSPIHRRCGTTFLFLVILLSILFYTFIPTTLSLWNKFLWRILLLPIIAGFSYEILKLGARIQNSAVINFFVLPGLWIQKLTTAQPNDKQLEVAIAAVKSITKNK